jgi:hypothetical protein
MISAGMAFFGLVIPIIDDLLFASIQTVLIFLMFRARIPITALGFIVESLPVVNFLPTMTLVCLLNGYKTGWRY